MPPRSPLLILTAMVLSISLVLPLAAQQVPNPVLPGPSGTGDGLTRDALETPPAPAPASTDHSGQQTTISRRRAARTSATAHRSSGYANISRHHRHHRVRSHSATMVASARHPGSPHSPIHQRAPLVSFIYWWNGWVVRTFHTRNGTVLLDTIGAKS